MNVFVVLRVERERVKKEGMKVIFHYSSSLSLRGHSGVATHSQDVCFPWNPKLG